VKKLIAGVTRLNVICNVAQLRYCFRSAMFVFSYDICQQCNIIWKRFQLLS